MDALLFWAQRLSFDQSERETVPLFHGRVNDDSTINNQVRALSTSVRRNHSWSVMLLVAFGSSKCHVDSTMCLLVDMHIRSRVTCYKMLICGLTALSCQCSHHYLDSVTFERYLSPAVAPDVYRIRLRLLR